MRSESRDRDTWIASGNVVANVDVDADAFHGLTMGERSARDISTRMALRTSWPHPG